MTQKHMEFLLGLADSQNRLTELQLATIKNVLSRLEILERLSLLQTKACLEDDEQQRKDSLTEMLKLQEEMREQMSGKIQSVQDLIESFGFYIDQSNAGIAGAKAMLEKIKSLPESGS